MLFIFEMQNGGFFESETKRDGINQIVNHYVENNKFCAIKSIYLVVKGEEREICKKVVKKIQHEIDFKMVQEQKLILDELESLAGERNYFSWRN